MRWAYYRWLGISSCDALTVRSNAAALHAFLEVSCKLQHIAGVSVELSTGRACEHRHGISFVRATG